MWVDIQVVAPPEREPVEIEDLKAQANLVDANASDDLLLSKLIAARERCEGFTRRSLITQTLDVYYHGLTGIGLLEFVPRGTVQEVVGFFVYDDYGVETEVENDTYSLMGTTILFNSWPPYFRSYLGVRLRIKSGYGDYPEDVPYALREGIREYATFLYDTRDGAGAEVKYGQTQGIPPGVHDKWRQYQLTMV